jgi:putative SOS response-associated peptidase YedK
MCGRFVSASPPDEIAKYFDAAAPEAALPESYNVAPTNDVYAVYETGGVRRLDAFHWGFVPHWAKDPSVGNRMINARAETLATKNAYKPSLRKRRCIIPADGFYEWKKVPGQKTKQPMFIHRRDGERLAFAGLWTIWRPKRADGDETGGPGGGTDEGDELHSCTIITTSANDDVAEVHDRMPVILGADDWSTWLDERNDDLDTLGRLLVPAPPKLIELRPVSTEVNNVRNKGSHLIDEVDPGADAGPVQGTLLGGDGDTSTKA